MRVKIVFFSLILSILLPAISFAANTLQCDHDNFDALHSKKSNQFSQQKELILIQKSHSVNHDPILPDIYDEDVNDSDNNDNSIQKISKKETEYNLSTLLFIASTSHGLLIKSFYRNRQLFIFYSVFRL